MDITAEDYNFLLTPVFFGLVAAAIIGWIIVVGLAMKITLAITAPETPSFKRALFIVFALTVTQIVVLVGGTMALGQSMGFVVAIVNFFMQLYVLGKMAGFGMFRAFFAHMLNGILGGIGGVALIVGLMMIFAATIGKDHPEELKQLAEKLRAAGEQVKEKQLAAANGFNLPSGGATSGAPMSYDIRDVFFQGANEGDGPAVDRGSMTMAPNVVPATGGGSLRIVPFRDKSKQKSNPFVK